MQAENTALLVAAQFGHFEVMRLLLDEKLEKRADINKANEARQHTN